MYIDVYHFALPPQEGQGLNVYVNAGLNVLRRRHPSNDKLRSLGADLVARERKRERRRRETERLVRKLFRLRRDTRVPRARVPNYEHMHVRV